MGVEINQAEADVQHAASAAICNCPACTGGFRDAADAVDASLDPQAGGTANNKPIWTAEQVAGHLNRSGAAWSTGPTDAVQQGDSDINTITFGFFNSQAELVDNGYVYQSPADGEFYGLAEYFNFASFNEAQRGAAREAMTAWDDVVRVSFVEKDVDDADITFGNLANAPETQAYSRLPLDRIFADDSVNAQSKEIAGDVWISASQPSNFRLDEGGYGLQTLTHEVGHSLGLSHPGAYNATPGVTFSYAANAEYAQDTRAYTIMSYFEASSNAGTRHFDFNISTTAYAGVPLIHDIAAAQRIYGADMTTRTGDTVYGFNSNAGRDAYDFLKTPAPIMAIWDAGGNDTIDASGFATNQRIDLAAGALSDVGGVTYDTAPTLAQVNANRALEGLAPVAQATYDSNMALLKANPIVGTLTNNVGIAYGAVIENAKGGSGNDSLLGNGVDNALFGNGGNDRLSGGEGNDALDGGTGNDLMLGGLGDDVIFVDSSGDIVTERAGEGTDTVSSSISYTLGADVENLVLTDGAADGTGNALDNRLVGNALSNRLDGADGADVLIGGDGVDYLTGGAGADTFVAEIDATKVSSKNGPIALDVILDFAGEDRVDLSGIDANALLAGDQAFTFVENAKGKEAGELSIRHFGNINAAEKSLGIEIDGVDGKSAFDGHVTVLLGNVDGGDPDFALVLIDPPAITVGELVL
ncbi:serralysin [Sphingomonas guangdongensis]|uniref:Serralysin n=1 Tax=Sphingomonas guangdongensis TaxID=1141890 RepID=A0A285QYK5_9SPHN|nr:M10 family metallopeptidase C-terminal domain-containing protein [Sphingomonas guangdongensis]SOB86548.1 serralysin [Sphingomonas guangdongensis]